MYICQYVHKCNKLFILCVYHKFVFSSLCILNILENAPPRFGIVKKKMYEKRFV